MLRTIFDAFTYLIAIFVVVLGAATLVNILISSLQFRKRKRHPGVRMALIVKNAEDVIEGTVRDIIIDDYLGKTITDGILTIIDMGSGDRTLEILHKLRYEYGSLDIIDGKEREKIFNIFS
ncbi:MAG TPA: hypothetical protein GXX20_10130 [Clostridiaceae bacterium]|nr:hypothetical protein [Clostridiaceae bacterium]